MFFYIYKYIYKYFNNFFLRKKTPERENLRMYNIYLCYFYILIINYFNLIVRFHFFK